MKPFLDSHSSLSCGGHAADENFHLKLFPWLLQWLFLALSDPSCFFCDGFTTGSLLVPGWFSLNHLGAKIIGENKNIPFLSITYQRSQTTWLLPPLPYTPATLITQLYPGLLVGSLHFLPGRHFSHKPLACTIPSELFGQLLFSTVLCTLGGPGYHGTVTSFSCLFPIRVQTALLQDVAIVPFFSPFIMEDHRICI